MKSFTSKKTLERCIYGCLHWRSQGNFNKREKVWRQKFDENGATNLQISLETILFEMVWTYIKTLVFWNLDSTANIMKPLLAKRFVLFLRWNLIKSYVWVVCRSICTTDSGAVHHLQNQIYERVWSLIIRDINNIK